jgi:ATP-dependent exoDNAse (exonuclease V) beta subunit
MTVHASKGLEFPIVFVANMGRGTGNQRPPIRVAAGRSGEPSVAIADFQSEADEDAQARELEETKRLLYVALTRARDRLYLSAVVQERAPRMGRGSLGEVLPPTLKAIFGLASCAAEETTVNWQPSGGRLHVFRVPGGPNLHKSSPVG